MITRTYERNGREGVSRRESLPGESPSTAEVAPRGEGVSRGSLARESRAEGVSPVDRVRAEVASTIASLAEERRVLGAIGRGSLGPRDLAELPLGWERGVGVGPIWEALADLHSLCLAGLLASWEAWGRVRLDAVVRLLSPELGELREGRRRGYLPELVALAPGRGQALRALGRVAYAAEERRESRAAGREVTRALGRVGLAGDEWARERMAAGLAAAFDGRDR